MLIVLTVVAIVCLVGAFILYNVFDSEYGSAGLTAIGIIILVGCVVGFCVCGSTLVGGNHIDEKIEMYEEENAKIEWQVAESVNAYLVHESEIMKNATEQINPESAITIVAAYPELNSSELITKQIELYNYNRAQIKSLKESKISLAVHRWWVYFG